MQLDYGFRSFLKILIVRIKMIQLICWHIRGLGCFGWGTSPQYEDIIEYNIYSQNIIDYFVMNTTK
jgi:hypothetical protein